MLYLLHQAIDRAAAQYPDKDAFRYNGESISYQSLLLHANALANEWIRDGVNPGDTIGLLLPKSLDMPIALFGSLKAGAVHVPLDANTPLERLSAILEDADIRRLVVSPEQSRLVEQLCQRPGSRLQFVVGVKPDTDLPCRHMQMADLKPAAKGPTVPLVQDDPAYLLFTSGSTGQPKGILHSHASALAYARLAAETYGLTPHDRLGNFAPLHFDQSTFEFYSGPLSACTTVLIPQSFAIATESLTALMESEALTIWYSVPSILIQLITRQALAGRNLSSFRWILFGGEPFPPKHLRELMNLIPQAHFSNVYGPTEVNQCTFHHLSPEDDLPAAIPIGQVWANAEYLLVDEADKPVEQGAAGEFLIRTPTMMLGYWRRDDLNDDAFHWRTEAGGQRSRFYRTGDLMRMGDGGKLAFLGRRDRQIKSRGYRVELDEIEAVLCDHDAVVEAGSFAVEDDSLGNVLHAAVRVSDGMDLTQRDLLKHCAGRLPTYARPQTIHILNKFPRTRTGKVDRAALADLIQQQT